MNVKKKLHEFVIILEKTSIK